MNHDKKYAELQKIIEEAIAKALEMQATAQSSNEEAANTKKVSEVNALSAEHGSPLSAIDINVNLNSNTPKWEDKYKLQSYYIHKELLDVFNTIAKRKGKGAKTLIINEALKEYLAKHM